MADMSANCVKALVFAAAALLLCSSAYAGTAIPQYRGRVIVIRGAFTVFSLGLNDLGDELAEYGFDVEVVPDILAGRAAADLVAEYRRNRNMGPIVFIGHSRGAELGPKEARLLQKYRIPVKLIVMVDAVHQTSIPSNVQRCVNLYHTNMLGILHGVPARAESKRTQMINTDIGKLKTRGEAGSINHFNIDASPWIHDLIVAEVLKVCPREEAKSSTARCAPESQDLHGRGIWRGEEERQERAHQLPIARITTRSMATKPGGKITIRINRQLLNEVPVACRL